MKYKRILLKLSGEQLAGKYPSGIDPDFAAWLAQEVRKVVSVGCQVVVVAGGGNMVRGEEIAGNGIKRVTADQMGMLSGLINSIALTDIFESQDLPTRCLSNIYAQQVAESYSFRLAEKHLQKRRVIIIAGGIARPYLTHDTAAISLALELDCQAVIKATKVDGVYDKDPTKHKDAKRHDKLNYQQAIENPDIKVLDKAAIGPAMEHGMPTIVSSVLNEDNLLKVISGENVGTTIA